MLIHSYVYGHSRFNTHSFVISDIFTSVFGKFRQKSLVFDNFIALSSDSSNVYLYFGPQLNVGSTSSGHGCVLHACFDAGFGVSAQKLSATVFHLSLTQLTSLTCHPHPHDSLHVDHSFVFRVNCVHRC